MKEQPRRLAGQVYKGWKLTFSSTRPVTGQWVSSRYGVSMCHSSKAALLRMVDNNVDSVAALPLHCIDNDIPY